MRLWNLAMIGPQVRWKKEWRLFGMTEQARTTTTLHITMTSVRQQFDSEVVCKTWYIVYISL